MDATGRRRTVPLLAAIVTASAVAVVACGGGGTPAVGAPPASAQTAAERAATLRWLAKTNQIYTRNDFSLTSQVTMGEARSAFLAQENQTRSDPGPGGRKPLRLASVSITVPCHQGAAATFVAYGDTNVFTLGQSSSRRPWCSSGPASRTWKLAAIVNQSSGGGPHAWPALCRSGAGTTAPAVLAPAGYAAALARALDHAATGARETAAAAAPFAVNPFFTGAGLVHRPVRHPAQAGPRRRGDAGGEARSDRGPHAGRRTRILADRCPDPDRKLQL